MLTQRHRGTERKHPIQCFSAPLCLCVRICLVLTLGANSLAFSAEVDPIKIALLVDWMANQGSGYDARELHALGADGLAGVLDYLLPETAPPRPPPQRPAEEEIRRLLQRLDADDFRAREAATEELIARGRGRRTLIEEAAQSDSLEVRLRAERVLASWESRPTNPAQRLHRRILGVRRRADRSPVTYDSRPADGEGAGRRDARIGSAPFAAAVYRGDRTRAPRCELRFVAAAGRTFRPGNRDFRDGNGGVLQN